MLLLPGADTAALDDPFNTGNGIGIVVDQGITRDAQLHPVGDRGAHADAGRIALTDSLSFDRLTVYKHLYANILVETPELDVPTALFGDQGQVSLCRRDGKHSFLAPVQAQLSLGESAVLVIAVITGILVKREGIIRTGEYQNIHIFSVEQPVFVLGIVSHRHDGTGLCQHRNGVQAAVQIQLSATAAGVMGAVEQVEPASLGQPCGDLAHAAGSILLFRNGRNHQLTAEPILIGHFVGRVALGMAVIHRLHQGQTLRMGAVVHGIDIGEQRMAQPQPILDDCLRLPVVDPGLLAGKLAVGAVEPVHRGQHTQLQPADKHLIIPIAAHMAADIMAPPGIADIGRHGGELGLELQRLPGHKGIAGEADGITLAAGAGIAGEEHGTLAVAGNIQNVQMIQHPQRIQPFPLILILSGLVGLVDPAVIGTLLPIHPPEVHTVLLIGMVDNVKIIRHMLLGQDVQRNTLAGSRIDAGSLSHFLVHCLVAAHTGGRVQVQRGFQIVAVQLFQEGLVVREQFLVPGVAGPAVQVIGHGTGHIHIHQMPIHIHNAHGEGNIFLPEAAHQIQVFLLGIGMVTAPPVAQSIGRQQRRHTGEAVKILHRRNIIIAVAEEIDIGGIFLADTHPAVLLQHKGIAVIQHGEAVAGHHAPLHGTRAVDGIQGLGCAAQVLEILAETPGRGRLLLQPDG